MLGELGARVAERRFFTDLPTEDEVRRLASLLPGGVHDLVSTRSRRFKELGLAEKQLTQDEWVALLAREPGLWRRPIAVKGRQVVIGWDEQALRELLS
ncbi:MAG: hypothetical protein DIU82_09860 [Bacillota bacterium]|nr:MAG: hypothetical protein DIU82_09860 [Bacillota bacterium]